MAHQRIFLIGLSGSGKSTVGRLLADRLGWEFADSDRLIEERTGQAIPDLFRERGEAAFRTIEAQTLHELAAHSNIVVATGGGAPTSDGGRAALARGLVAWLDVTPERAAARLAADPATERRPLLEGDLLRRLEDLHCERVPVYSAAADGSIAVDFYDPPAVVERIVALVSAAEPSPPEPTAPVSAFHIASIVRTPARSYPVIVQDGALHHVGEICREVGLQGRAFVVSDTAVAPLFATAVIEALEREGYRTLRVTIPAGEAAKTLATVGLVYDALLAERVERRDFVVAVGGGVVTDLAGYAAATILRGIAFVHVPTSTLGMLDAAIGGKTGVDHRLGKNMIGAFAQPSAVVIDPEVIASLPERHRRNGWAELLKHAFILDAALIDALEARVGDPGAWSDAGLISSSVAIKASVVSEDEREAGRRTLLNYGHTVGHAIETVTGYERYLHGEAVAIGMRVAGTLSRELGLLSATEFDRQQALIRAYGLPESAAGIDAAAVLEATLQDKKVKAGAVQWVLLAGLGNAVVRGDVPPALVRATVEAVCR